ncbi:hypothetical protein HPB51_020181 [Rhipicephalus microplus]|uniref:Uncharacterized protein n=1 Tax=Rhipicephalus microplus TaxID=6941 RepID=A0A9J6D6Y4_RHIMP|nr:hypothetical protein HPB51_020181 [Rhipicephalus microplus]
MESRFLSQVGFSQSALHIASEGNSTSVSTVPPTPPDKSSEEARAPPSTPATSSSQPQQPPSEAASPQAGDSAQADTSGPIRATPSMWRCSKIMHLQRDLHPTVLSSLEGIVDQVIFWSLDITT